MLYLAYLIKHDDSIINQSSSIMVSQQLCRTRIQANRHIAYETLDYAIMYINDYDMDIPKSCEKYIRVSFNGYEMKKEYTYDSDVATLFYETFCTGDHINYMFNYYVESIEID